MYPFHRSYTTLSSESAQPRALTDDGLMELRNREIGAGVAGFCEHCDETSGFVGCGVTSRPAEEIFCVTKSPHL